MQSDLREYIAKVPKVELHHHLAGSIRAGTLLELADREGVELPTRDLDQLYAYDNIYDFLVVFGIAGRVMQRRDDFARVTYESLVDGVEVANLRYREMFVNPTEHMRHGARYRDVIDGIVDGARLAEDAFGVRCRIIPSIYRGDSHSEIEEMMDAILDYRPEEVIGLGMDAAELPNPPQQYERYFKRARAAGLRLTSHCAEDGPAENLAFSVDVLGIERVDHGYHVLDDRGLTNRLRYEGMHFTCCPNSTAKVYGWSDLGRHPIVGMIEAGLSISIGSDDPTMHGTDLAKDFRDLCEANAYDRTVVDRLVLDGIEGTWLDDEEKRAMRAEFLSAMERLGSHDEIRPSAGWDPV